MRAGKESNETIEIETLKTDGDEEKEESDVYESFFDCDMRTEYCIQGKQLTASGSERIYICVCVCMCSRTNKTSHKLTVPRSHFDGFHVGCVVRAYGGYTALLCTIS